ncbi:ATP-binding protein [Corallococcus sp. AB018]|uniref:AAA family ATPase n=1 Tax=Corallococcus sp. AB018 TaxID=2316715 RepID=UPI000F898AA7|nr:ATP-binding protein [Corallococcus sp. AB018]RUO94548.1 ATP-binding protein [Corallococcus sp. AB018]
MPPPSAPLLPSFRIQGFRAFRDLEIPRLGRVNLIVGKNNVGKTTVLEALKVYAAGSDAAWELKELLEFRQEVHRHAPRDDKAQRINIMRAFFQPSEQPALTSFYLSTRDLDPKLSVRLGRSPLMQGAKGSRASETSFIAADEKPSSPQDELEEEVLQVRITTGSYRYHRVIDLSDLRTSSVAGGSVESRLNAKNSFACQYLPARGIKPLDIGPLWDSIVLTNGEQSALQALRIIAPDIERVSLVEGALYQGTRYALVARRGHTSPEPLQSMGDGMNRIFELALGLVNSKHGIFLIDEVESGVHYAAQEQLWRFIFEASSQLGVQVFATTHSWDCITAFQKAASAHPADGMLISLAQSAGNIKATVFNEGDLEIITRESIEVR